ncbi:hypothetical protein GUITHDRAFT_161213 [Guillardia theta CCMP2712]|uniref:CAAX prenyl protease n=1 Tax=Guillardia theta (strain CCMP2712) TaxID=905079 RepID=L1JVB8_GUITC|nr:hypothetical protein GUITHDRAFT_161213 [Guillardia theta CCMP2712]EKX52526.1 hypothetical protein GUITHDRAFT_161213 [Guillardia theta CCMP2712]|eukprot:XP_005839506.1 hypothetical protein GUITHDRAFT_161213 [Guillardia theta CCMP2712]
MGSEGDEGAIGAQQELFLLFSVLSWAMELYFDLRQHKKLCQKKLPQELQGIVTEEEFLKANEYSRDKISFEMMSSGVNITATIFFYLMGGLLWMWEVSLILIKPLGFSEQNEIWQSVSFCIVLYAKSIIESAPLDLYQTFVIEERHGFNKQTLSLWFMDQVKTFFLVVVLLFPAVAGGIHIIIWGGKDFWFYIWSFCLVLVLVFQTIYPQVIQPLFNTFTPLKDGSLKSAIEDLARAHNFPLKKLFVVDGSTRSSHSNAYFYGFGNNKRVVLFDTLNLSLLGKEEKNGQDETGKSKESKSSGCKIEEIVAILGHELGHWAKAHIYKQLFVAELHLLIFFYMFGYMLHNQGPCLLCAATDLTASPQEMYAAFGFQSKRPVIIGLILFSNMGFLLLLLLLLSCSRLHSVNPVEHFVQFFQQFVTRMFEFEADRFAVEQGHGKELAAALVKISTENKSNLDPDPLWSAYNNSHPSLVERLRAMTAHASVLEARQKKSN